MNEKIGLPSYTIHRLLEWDPVSNMCMKNKHHPLDADIIIIDEASMIDLEMMTRIADAIKNSCRLVLLGDADQLPSVSHGCILRDFIQSKQIPTVRLQKIFRQEKNSAIIDTACSIKNGSMPKFLNDCLFISESKPENFLPRIQALINEKYGKSISLSDVQILTPLYKGKAGAHNLNQNVQKNSSSQDHIPFFRKFRLHDKVIQLNNDYENNVYNGDLGIIKSYDEENETITVDFSNKTILYDNETFHTIELAYAITIHKSQGSEFPIIAIPIFMEHFIMLNRQLIYTAITRAKELCILVGEKRALACAIKKEEATHRKTYLQNLLQE